jgi:3-hydroxyisobutyrate dehydrogenase-like beta-hydroxyacid dehydrogenase
MKITIIGFGEAGQSISKGLVSAATAIAVYDIRFSGPERDKLIERAKEYGAVPHEGLADAIAGSDIIMSAVVADVAIKVSADVAAAISPGQVFIDLNSVSPRTKQAISRNIEGREGDFIEAVVMARVAGEGHKTPMLFAGPLAADISEKLNDIGMNTQAVGKTIGQASANKMLRSIMAKGISALLLECLVAAHRYGIVDRILGSVATSFPGIDWDKTSNYYLGRVALHGQRMGAEMNEVAETLSDIGLDPVMARAIGARIAWGGKILAGYPWPNGEPGDRHEILAAIEQRLAAG